MYKFSNEEHTEVTNTATGVIGIHKGVWRWREYEKWLESGGITAPFDTSTDAEKLSTLRKDLVLKIKEQRDARKSGGVYINKKWFHTDEPSRLQYLALTLLGDNLPTVQWKTMDKTFISMTKNLLMAVFQAGVSLDLTLFQRAEELIELANNSSNPTRININSGWPENFFNK